MKHIYNNKFTSHLSIFLFNFWGKVEEHIYLKEAQDSKLSSSQPMNYYLMPILPTGYFIHQKVKVIFTLEAYTLKNKIKNKL